jgi:hypothetical protein
MMRPSNSAKLWRYNFDAETVASIRKQDLRVLENGETVSAEADIVLAKTGETATCLAVKPPSRGPDGGVSALCCIPDPFFRWSTVRPSHGRDF